MDFCERLRECSMSIAAQEEKMREESESIASLVAVALELRFFSARMNFSS
jgi:hypothetical protein